jgi:hypothetical protein
MGIPSSLSQNDAWHYIVYDQVLIPPLDRETFSRIVSGELQWLSRVFSSVGIGKLRDGIGVHTEDLSDEVMEMRAELLFSLVKEMELHYIFVGSHGELHDVVIDVDWRHRTPSDDGPRADAHWFYPAAYLGEIEPGRIFDLGAEGYSSRRNGYPVQIVDVLSVIDGLLVQKRRKEEDRIKLIDTALRSVSPKKQRAEKARQYALRR